MVAVIGAGPVGLAAIAIDTDELSAAGTVIAIDSDENRLEQARLFRATDVVVSGNPGWKQQVLALTDGVGVGVAIEVVGVPETSNTAIKVARPGGNMANVGVHGKPVELHLEDLWIQNIDISMGLVNTNTTPMLRKLVARRRSVPASWPLTGSRWARSWRRRTPSPGPRRRRH